MGTSGRSPRIGASPAAVALLAILCFAAGGAAGAIVYHQATCDCNDQVWSRKGPTWKADQMERWTETLSLEGEQRARFEQVLDGAYRRYRILYAEMEPQKQAIDAELRANVSAILNPDQRRRYEAALEEAEKRRRAYYGRVDLSAVANPVKAASAPAGAARPGGADPSKP
jgi:uncharacterized membrane protein